MGHYANKCDQKENSLEIDNNVKQQIYNLLLNSDAFDKPDYSSANHCKIEKDFYKSILHVNGLFKCFN